MYDFLIINGGMMIAKVNGMWLHNGAAVDPRAIIRDLASRQDEVGIIAYRADGIADAYDYVGGRHYTDRR
jgi:hypothetical protein|uniref:Uncharacterized protein n=1 Tax=Myoviridae sp. ctqfO1 TaxID=2827710 RepID=A0A8S5T378_9CAUD|nr:MAG TPA: hypothetical protein [Myoviridae sp. ctqfO1]